MPITPVYMLEKLEEILTGFRQFILRGNAVDLAVGVVIGAAFGSITNALVKDLLTPLIAAIFKAPDFSKLSFTLHKSQFFYGDFINVLINFALVAIVVYFFVVLPMNTLQARLHRNDAPLDPTTKQCPFCLSADIPKDAKKCKYCATDLTTQ